MNELFANGEVDYLLNPLGMQRGFQDQVAENRFHLTETKADVIFAFFGYNESFAGEAGLPAFKKDLDVFRDFASLLPEGTRAAFEFRHASWHDAAVFDVLRSVVVFGK